MLSTVRPRRPSTTRPPQWRPEGDSVSAVSAVLAALVRRGGAGTRRWGRRRRRIGRRAEERWGIRWCRSRGGRRRRLGAAADGRLRSARRARAERLGAAPGRAWTSCPWNPFVTFARIEGVDRRGTYAIARPAVVMPGRSGGRCGGGSGALGARTLLSASSRPPQHRRSAPACQTAPRSLCGRRCCSGLASWLQTRSRHGPRRSGSGGSPPVTAGLPRRHRRTPIASRVC
jgi:hypothetical protein